MSTKTVAVVDYGMGNLRSVSQAVLHAANGTGWQVEVCTRPEQLMAADRVVLPGQGAMPDCMRELRESGLLPALQHAAAHKPLFGVCVGMQMLLQHSEEGPTDCLGLIPGEVRRFALDGRLQADGSRFKVPQMGWNQVHQVHQAADGGRVHPLWDGVPDGAHFYFVHSFYATPSQPEHCAGRTDYGDWFSSAVARDNLFATQFHPEANESMLARWTAGGGSEELSRLGLTPQNVMAQTRDNVSVSRVNSDRIVDWFVETVVGSNRERD